MQEIRIILFVILTLAKIAIIVRGIVLIVRSLKRKDGNALKHFFLIVLFLIVATIIEYGVAFLL